MEHRSLSNTTKKDDLAKLDNYRRTILLEIYKSVANVVHPRLQPIDESKDHEGQCGFRQEFSCGDVAFCRGDNDKGKARTS